MPKQRRPVTPSSLTTHRTLLRGAVWLIWVHHRHRHHILQTYQGLPATMVLPLLCIRQTQRHQLSIRRALTQVSLHPKFLRVCTLLHSRTTRPRSRFRRRPNLELPPLQHQPPQLRLADHILPIQSILRTRNQWRRTHLQHLRSQVQQFSS